MVYTGCLDDNDIPNGYGKIEMNNNHHEGCWRYGVREGEGLFISESLIIRTLERRQMHGEGEFVQFFENNDTLTQIDYLK